MTRKDYIKFADMIRARHDEIVEVWFVKYSKTYIRKYEELDAMAREMANIFAEDNPRFDRDRFIKACFDFSRTHELADQMV
tara:strand:+ start:448 stop:690 length:243 start_codon:yes stop_codon:yes gene_type:complete